MTTPVYLEVGRKRVFALAVDWPGWARSGRTPEAAIDALAARASRYAVVAHAAGHPLPADAVARFDVVAEVPGDTTTDFGAPNVVTDLDRAPVGPDEARRLADLLVAAWGCLDAAAAEAPATLRKGPRGGGRDRDEVVRHVLAAEAFWVRRIGVRLPQPAVGDVAALAAFRHAVAGAVRGGEPDDQRWPLRYLVRRAAWHVLDHAWEIEDKGGP